MHASIAAINDSGRLVGSFPLFLSLSFSALALRAISGADISQVYKKDRRGVRSEILFDVCIQRVIALQNFENVRKQMPVSIS